MKKLMTRTALLCATALSGALALAAQSPLAGRWEGTLQLSNRGVGITIDLAQDGKGVWVGNFGVPEQGATGLRCEKLKIAGKLVKFSVPEAPGGPDVEATLQEGGALVGNLIVQGSAFQFNLRRTGEARIAATTASPAVDPRMEGDWEGRLQMPGGSMRLVFHIQNQPDKTVKATLDSPEQNALGMTLSDIVQRGASIEMKLKMVNGGFKGVLNEAGTEIAGEWTQGTAVSPLVLKKAAK